MVGVWWEGRIVSVCGGGGESRGRERAGGGGECFPRTFFQATNSRNGKDLLCSAGNAAAFSTFPFSHFSFSFPIRRVTLFLAIRLSAL